MPNDQFFSYVMARSR